MNNYLTVIPFTRVNELWVNHQIDVTPVNQSFRHALIEDAANSIDSRFQPNFYKKIAIDIVAETVYNYPYPCITEKILRPIACKKMFIVVAPAGVLDLLHRKGFQTFGDVIDESYDAIIDPNERFVRVQQTILDFISKPLSEIQKIYKQKIDVCEHNFQTLTMLETLELDKIHDN
jgi:hypothetical protein